MNCGRLESLLVLAKNRSLMLKHLNVCQIRSISFLSAKGDFTNRLQSKQLLKLTPVSNNFVQSYFVSANDKQKKKAEEHESAFSSLVQGSEKSSVSTHVTGAKRGSDSDYLGNCLSTLTICKIK